MIDACRGDTDALQRRSRPRQTDGSAVRAERRRWMKDTLRAILPPAHWQYVSERQTDINTSETSVGTNDVEVLLTGVGAQGIQLLSRTLALAAVAEGHQAMMSATTGDHSRRQTEDCRRRPGSASVTADHPSAWAGMSCPLFWEATRGVFGLVDRGRELLPASEDWDEPPVPRVQVFLFRRTRSRRTWGPIELGIRSTCCVLQLSPA